MKKKKKWIKEALWPGVITAFAILGIGAMILLVLVFDAIKFLVLSTIMLCIWVWFTIRKVLSKKYLKVRSQRMLISSMNAFEKRLPLILTAFIVFMLWIVTTYLCVSYGIKFDSPVRTIFVGMAISFVVGIFLFELIKANSDKIIKIGIRIFEKIFKGCGFSFIDQHFFVWKKCNGKNGGLLYI